MHFTWKCKETLINKNQHMILQVHLPKLWIFIRMFKNVYKMYFLRWSNIFFFNLVCFIRIDPSPSLLSTIYDYEIPHPLPSIKIIARYKIYENSLITAALEYGNADNERSKLSINIPLCRKRDDSSRLYLILKDRIVIEMGQVNEILWDTSKRNCWWEQRICLLYLLSNYNKNKLSYRYIKNCWVVRKKRKVITPNDNNRKYLLDWLNRSRKSTTFSKEKTIWNTMQKISTRRSKMAKNCSAIYNSWLNTINCFTYK